MRLSLGHIEQTRIPEIWIHAALASAVCFVEIVGLERFWLGWRHGPRASRLGAIDLDV